MINAIAPNPSCSGLGFRQGGKQPILPSLNRLKQQLGPKRQPAEQIACANSLMSYYPSHNLPLYVPCDLDNHRSAKLQS